MTIQLIVTGESAADLKAQLAGFLPSPPPTALQSVAGNGAVTQEEPAKAAAPAKRRTAPKKEPEPEQEKETATETAAADDIDEDLDIGRKNKPTEATPDDVRAALTEFYLEKYGRENTQKDILKLYKIIFPDGSVTKVSDIPPGKHADVIEGIKEMAAKNPFERKAL